MKNMYMTPLNYENFKGEKKSTKLYFHLTPREFMDWMVANPKQAKDFQDAFEGMQEAAENNPDGQASEAQVRAMLGMVKVLAELSNGEPSADGEYFDKSEAAKFAHSARYEAFRMLLFTNTKELNTFISTLLSDDVVSEFAAALARTETKELPQPASNGTNPVQQERAIEDMSPEELREALRSRG